MRRMAPVLFLVLFICLASTQAEVVIEKTLKVGGGGELYTSTDAKTGTGIAGDRVIGRGDQFYQGDIDQTETKTTLNSSYTVNSSAPWFHNSYMSFTATNNKEYSRYINSLNNQYLQAESTFSATDTELKSTVNMLGSGGVTDVAIDATKRKPIELSRTTLTGPFELGITFDAFVPITLSDWLPCPSGIQLDNSTAWRPRNLLTNASGVFDISKGNTS
jgi:hypothetical protein